MRIVGRHGFLGRPDRAQAVGRNAGLAAGKPTDEEREIRAVAAADVGDEFVQRGLIGRRGRPVCGLGFALGPEHAHDLVAVPGRRERGEPTLDPGAESRVGSAGCRVPAHQQGRPVDRTLDQAEGFRGEGIGDATAKADFRAEFEPEARAQGGERSGVVEDIRLRILQGGREFAAEGEITHHIGLAAQQEDLDVVGVGLNCQQQHGSGEEMTGMSEE